MTQLCFNFGSDRSSRSHKLAQISFRADRAYNIILYLVLILVRSQFLYPQKIPVSKRNDAAVPHLENKYPVLKLLRMKVTKIACIISLCGLYH